MHDTFNTIDHYVPMTIHRANLTKRARRGQIWDYCEWAQIGPGMLQMIFTTTLCTGLKQQIAL